VLCLAAACAAPGTGGESLGEIRCWGTLREALRDGRTQARVDVASVAGKGVYAVGALAGLEGEVTVLDGEIWVSKGKIRPPATTRSATASAPATVLFAAEVPHWQDVEVEENVDPSVFEEFLEQAAARVGLDPGEPFAFVVEGPLTYLRMHVIAGECPMRARMLNKEISSPPYEKRVDRVEGRLVGIFATNAAGKLTHQGAKTHTHVLLSEGDGITGHVESVGIAAGSVLRLPQR
jgi:alpha-acetolactate decarboxylase